MGAELGFNILSY